MRTFLLILALLAAPVAANSQVLGIGVRAGYTFSSSFKSKLGNSGSLQGPEVAVDIPVGLPLPIQGLGGLQFLVSPSLFTAQGGWSPSDFQGTVFRLVGCARASLPGSPLYVRVGAGYANASASSSDFASRSSYETQYAVGIGVLNNLPAIKVTAELAYHQSPVAQISGWTIGLSVRF